MIATDALTAPASPSLTVLAAPFLQSEGSALAPIRAPIYALLELWSVLLNALAGVTGLELLQYGILHRAILVGLCIGVMAPPIRPVPPPRHLPLTPPTPPPTPSPPVPPEPP